MDKIWIVEYGNVDSDDVGCFTSAHATEAKAKDWARRNAEEALADMNDIDDDPLYEIIVREEKSRDIGTYTFILRMIGETVECGSDWWTVREVPFEA